MQVPTEKITRIITSHWHRDHTGGLLSFLKLRSEQAVDASRCVMDVHPDRPYARGIAPGPNYDKVICSLPADPEFSEMEQLGGVVEKHAEEHVVAGGTVYVSGEIPRVTPYEQGILGGKRWVDEKWVSEPVRILKSLRQ